MLTTRAARRRSYLKELHERRQVILGSIDEQGKLTDELREKLSLEFEVANRSIVRFYFARPFCHYCSRPSNRPFRHDYNPRVTVA